MKDRFKKTFYNDLDSGLIYFMVLIIPVIFGLILTIIFGLIANALGYVNFNANPILFSIYIGLITISFLITFLIYNKIVKIDFKKAGLFKFKFGWVNLILCIIIALVTLFGFNNFVNYLFYLLEQIGYVPDTNLPLPLNSGWWLVTNLFILAFLPAICEEVIYRGIILNGFRKFGKLNAVLLSSLFFALAHGSAMQFIYQYILGVVLAYVVIKTGSIYAGILVHFINNASVLIYNYILPTQQTIIFTTPVIIFSFVLAISSIGLLYLLINWLKEKKSVQISYNEEYNTIWAIPEKNFSNSQSRFIFWTSILISVVIWSIGTFLS